MHTTGLNTPESLIISCYNIGITFPNTHYDGESGCGFEGAHLGCVREVACWSWIYIQMPC